MGKTPGPQKRKGTSIFQRIKNNENQRALYLGYRIKLEELKTKYQNVGLTNKSCSAYKKEWRLYKKEVTAPHLDWINAINSIYAIDEKRSS